MEIFDGLGDRVGLAHMYGLSALADLSIGQRDAAKIAAHTAWHLCRASPQRYVTGWIELISNAIDALTGEANLDAGIRDALVLYAGRSHDSSVGRRNEISYPLVSIVEPATCDDVNFSGLVVPFRLLADELTMISDVLIHAGEYKIARSYLKHALEYACRTDDPLDIGAA